IPLMYAWYFCRALRKDSYLPFDILSLAEVSSIAVTGISSASARNLLTVVDRKLVAKSRTKYRFGSGITRLLRLDDSRTLAASSFNTLYRAPRGGNHRRFRAPFSAFFRVSISGLIGTCSSVGFPKRS